MNFNHKTVLLHETVESIDPKKGGVFVDCTAGGGGHTALLLKSVPTTSKVIAFDRDPMAQAHLKKIFESDISVGRLQLIEAPFSQLKEKLLELDLFGQVSGIFADIGVSSPQLDLAERGFSFMHDGPLDMRMSAEGSSAADLVNELDETDLANIIYEFGEEVKSRAIARAIVQARQLKPFSRTRELADLIKRAAKWHHDSKKHPATKTFQALRIAVNNELKELETLVNDGFEALNPKGRLAIITFHSLEDRIVKHAFQKLAGKRLENNLPREFAAIMKERASPSSAEIIKPFPVTPSEQEIADNPRARSAKLRVLEKLGVSIS